MYKYSYLYIVHWTAFIQCVQYGCLQSQNKYEYADKNKVQIQRQKQSTNTKTKTKHSDKN